MKALEKLKKNLTPGHTYRRSDFLKFTTNADRYLKQLVDEGSLKKLSTGLYLFPKETSFGEAPPDEYSLLKTFLKDDHFVIYSPGQFNSLGLGTTQLYTSRTVFNRKRSGELEVGGRKYAFRWWREAPKTMTKEFLFVEFLNRLGELPEDNEKMLKNLQKKLKEFDSRKLSYAVDHYGNISAKNRFQALSEHTGAR